MHINYICMYSIIVLCELKRGESVCAITRVVGSKTHKYSLGYDLAKKA